MKEWKQGRVILPSGMHGQSFFPSGWGGTGHRVKSLEQGRVTVKLGAFLGWDGAVLKFFGASAAIFPGTVVGAGRGGTCIPALKPLSH